MTNLPKFTVLYNITNMSKWIGTGREFFDTKENAQTIFDIRTNYGYCCTLRPFDIDSDLFHLGAVHRPNLKINIVHSLKS